MLIAFIGYSTLVFAQEEGMGELEQDKSPVTEDRSTYTIDSENELIPLKPAIKRTENSTPKQNPPKTSNICAVNLMSGENIFGSEPNI